MFSTTCPFVRGMYQKPVSRNTINSLAESSSRSCVIRTITEPSSATFISSIQGYLVPNISQQSTSARRVPSFDQKQNSRIFPSAAIQPFAVSAIPVRLEQGYVNGVVTFSVNSESATGGQKHKSGHKRQYFAYFFSHIQHLFSMWNVLYFYCAIKNSTLEQIRYEGCRI